MMRIRKFKTEDAKEVSRLISKTLRKINSKDYSKKTVNTLINHRSPKKIISKSETRHYYLAVEGSKIIGVGSYSEDDLHSFFVLPEYLGKGVGRKIIERVLKEVVKEGIKVMNCASTPYAENFYKKIGFKKIKKKTVDYFGYKLPIILMKKRLK